MTWPEPPILVAIIAVSGVGLGAWLTWLASGSNRLQARVDSLEAKYAALWEARERDALIKRAQGDHIDVLEHHIWRQLPPPPPQLPDGI